ncbi:MAG: TIGR04076 family protein [Candidatus Eisenbacteria sp.]|nr:TIGR04076 family protein [Candidatus Eisenbacteria bacterium]
MKDLKIEVAEIRKRCGAGHRVGDCFYVRGQGRIEIPQGKTMCMFALQSLIPFLIGKQRENELPGDDWIRETTDLCCPDPDGILFRVTAV